MKVPPKRKGNPKFTNGNFASVPLALNESPSEKEGKYPTPVLSNVAATAPLNESPSEKEGKW